MRGQSTLAARRDDNGRARLIEIIAEKSLLRDNQIQLVSGKTSTFYFNMKPTAFDPEAANIISSLILEALQDEAVDYIGGLEMGAVPLIACVCQMSFPARNIPGFFVRKQIKTHGTQSLIEGVSPADLMGKDVVLIDDVTTTGGSVLNSVQAARDAGAKVDIVITVVDRLEGAEENLAEQGVKLIPLLTADAFTL